MAYTALYRVWRPQTFGDLVGQSHVTTTLRNAIREERLSHAYLFNGPRGTGKTSAAKIMAKAVNCEQPQDGEPCNQCRACQAITDGAVTDVLEIDAASNRGVEEIRDIRDKVKFAPSDVTYKVYIIDEVHMLTTEAFNALLKTLEEPPSHVLFILATTEPHKLPATIISRCQRFDFHRISLQETVGRLRHICNTQQVEVEEQALQLVAKKAEGGMRDALSLLDQAISYSGTQVTLSDIIQITGTVSQTYFSVLAKLISAQDVSGVMEQFDQVMVQGKDPEQFLHDFMFYYRDMLLAKTAPSLQEIVERAMVDEQFMQVAQQYSIPLLYEVIEALSQALTQLKWSTYARVLVELTLVKLCQPTGKALGSQVQAAPQADAASSDEVQLLNRRVAMLEEKITQLLSNQMVGAAPVAADKPKTREPRRMAQAPGGSRTPMAKVRDAARSIDAAMTQRIRGSWSQILTEIKKIKIQYQAWIVNGQPVAASQDSLIVVFTSSIHCEKTMEAELRGVVERTLQLVCGKPLTLLSIMEEEWQELQSQLGEPESAREKNPDEPDPFVAEALKLVGKNLLEIKD